MKLGSIRTSRNDHLTKGLVNIFWKKELSAQAKISLTQTPHPIVQLKIRR
jgi:predicted metal-dependent enzyme (double-stranded beta helix superfamily)